MDIDKETQEKIQELQSYEQSLQNLLMQKQAFQVELSETENALSEVNQTKDNIYRIIGNIMVKTDKDKVEKELKHKKELLAIRIKSIDKQQTVLTKDLEALREDVMKKIK